MATLEIEIPSTVSQTWIDTQTGSASQAYVAGLSSSVDFASETIRDLRQRIAELPAYHLVIDLGKGFAQGANSLQKVPRALTVDASLNHPDLPRAEARLEYLSGLDLSQSFETLEAPSETTLQEAGVLIRKLAAFDANRYLPDLGLDSDGFLVFSFHPERTGMVGSLSVFGDGTYSYCIEVEGKSVECGAAAIAEPISEDLKAFFTR